MGNRRISTYMDIRIHARADVKRKKIGTHKCKCLLIGDRRDATRESHTRLARTLPCACVPNVAQKGKIARVFCCRSTKTSGPEPASATCQRRAKTQPQGRDKDATERARKKTQPQGREKTQPQ